MYVCPKGDSDQQCSLDRNLIKEFLSSLQRFFSRENYSNLLLRKFLLFYVSKLVTNTMGHHIESKLWRITKQPVFHSIANMKHLICTYLICIQNLSVHVYVKLCKIQTDWGKTETCHVMVYLMSTVCFWNFKDHPPFLFLLSNFTLETF